ncbi:hypothetical protein PHAVU_009G068600 [Phaseolus vulgaris]|uniref:Uncharacterized protein n=1 Tax=Phaseolus vulgaris TaxID=3885 RepID=V7ATU6_PHAVU|nr:hypothetical protein PHAVU_009G068600g [Phaseolus vulgaris]ESW08715.1 hypothetical protein PHAVU_009G068600g [Phaseolus vulgaris]
MLMKKSLCISLVTVMLVLSSQLWLVHSRVLRSKELTEVAGHSVELKGSGSSLWKGFFAVSSNNSTTRVSKRSLAFRLASGPSKKGPGH